MKTKNNLFDMKINTRIIKSSIGALLFTVLIGCSDQRNKNEGNHEPSKPDQTVLQLAGFNAEIVFEEGDMNKNQVFFFYQFDDNNFLRIYRVSETNFRTNVLDSPIESNVGGTAFAPTILGHGFSEGLITNAKIQFNYVMSCTGQKNAEDKSPVTYTHPQGEQTIDIHRSLNLHETIAFLHETFDDQNAGQCASYSELKNEFSPDNVKTAVYKVNILFQIETATGEKSDVWCSLHLKGVGK